MTDEREEHFTKFSVQRTSTEDGMQMDANEAQFSNTLLSIRVTFESESNCGDVRELQQLKQSALRTSTDDGIQIDFNARQP
jgi:hypothetical protein